MGKRTYAVAAAIVFSITSGAQAHLFTVDQSNDALGFDIRTIQLFVPIRQEFRPALSTLDVVDTTMTMPTFCRVYLPIQKMSC
jgi:hypothetical protein